MAAIKGINRDSWNITNHLLYHLSFTSELIGIREELMLQEECGIALSEWRILSVMASFKPISSKDITRVTTLNKVAVSRAIARLTREGLIERVAASSDNRMQYLSLTAAGKQKFCKARASVDKWTGSLLNTLEPREIEELKTYLMRLRKRLGEITDEERARNETFIFGSKGRP